MATKENLVNYYGGKELAESFRTVRKNTLAVAQDIPEEKYSFRVAPETRSVGEMLTHIALAPTFQKKIHGEDRRTTLEGFDFPALMQRMHAEEKTSRTKAQVIELLTKDGDALASWMESLPDNFLGEVITMPAGATPAARTRFDMILSVKEHEMHHRAQLMLIERIVGIVPHLTRRMQERMNAAAAKK
ncbi:MAG TPA: DinB family protein [Verrucomicrobiae bacterium]|nr:DinB family protein [Verrucomicrobiae bacterium]